VSTFWIAIGGGSYQIPVLVGFSLACSIAASDILYAVCDFDFDRAHGIKSIPARFGIQLGVTIAKLLHGVSVLSLLVLSLSVSMSMVVSTIAVGALIVFSYYKFDYEARFCFINSYSGIIFLLGSIMNLSIMNLSIMNLSIMNLSIN
jgi:4-hydroxybenzoate polyprenyltransferase